MNGKMEALRVLTGLGPMARQALQDTQRLLMCPHQMVGSQIGRLSMSTPCGADAHGKRHPYSPSPQLQHSQPAVVGRGSIPAQRTPELTVPHWLQQRG
jgi:hypothetical protein